MAGVCQTRHNTSLDINSPVIMPVGQIAGNLFSNNIPFMAPTFFRECSWCGKEIMVCSAVVIKVDAAGTEHCFHPNCWKEHIKEYTRCEVKND